MSWLKTQLDANWQNTYKHKMFYEMSTRFFMTNWLFAY